MHRDASQRNAEHSEIDYFRAILWLAAPFFSRPKVGPRIDPPDALLRLRAAHTPVLQGARDVTHIEAGLWRNPASPFTMTIGARHANYINDQTKRWLLQ